MRSHRLPTVKHKSRATVFVGLSGGVDSSVSAMLLKDQGYDVTGVFIKVWQPDWIECTWKEDRLDAMRVCARLNIPFVTLDLSKEYKKEVVDYMIAEYKLGRTPNPDVMCNRHVKFGGFYNWAMKQGAEFVATGHYARVQAMTNNQETIARQISSSKLKTKNYQLLTGLDSNKDQSYFLWQIRTEQLRHILFPVGDLEKPEVRRLAKKFGLTTADKKDSQGLCFMGKVDVKEFLKRFIKTKVGKVLNEKGEVVGTHDGAVFFTLGERHGFSVQTNAEAKPYYVIAKDVEENTIMVSHNSKAGVDGDSRTVFEIEKVNWISGVPADGTPLLARLRYRQPLQEVKIVSREPKTGVEFKEPQSGGASGQSIVLYDGEVCLGGGIIA